MSGEGNGRARAAKDAAFAAYMKRAGITRTAGMCPMGCGQLIALGGSPLLEHLGRCRGAPRQDRRRR